MLSLQSVVLSALPHHVALETPIFPYKRGDTIEDLEVVRVAKRGVFIKLDKGLLYFTASFFLFSDKLITIVYFACEALVVHNMNLSADVLGFVHLSKLSDKEKIEKVPANCRVGSTHKARIMGFRLADNLVSYFSF